jgi:hypothetical protein
MLAAAARSAARASRGRATAAAKRFSSSSSHEEEVKQMGLWRTVTFAGKEREGGLGRGGGRRGQGWGDSAVAALAPCAPPRPPRAPAHTTSRRLPQAMGEAGGGSCGGRGLPPARPHPLLPPSPARAAPCARRPHSALHADSVCVCARSREGGGGERQQAHAGQGRRRRREWGARSPRLFAHRPPPPPLSPPRSRPRLHRVLHLLPGQRAPARGGQAGPGVHKRAQQAVSVGGEAPVPPGRPPQGALKCREGRSVGGGREREGGKRDGGLTRFSRSAAPPFCFPLRFQAVPPLFLFVLQTTISSVFFF